MDPNAGEAVGFLKLHSKGWFPSFRKEYCRLFTQRYMVFFWQPTQHMCWDLNCHYFHMIGDGHRVTNPIVEVYIPMKKDSLHVKYKEFRPYHVCPFEPPLPQKNQYSKPEAPSTTAGTFANSESISSSKGATGVLMCFGNSAQICFTMSASKGRNNFFEVFHGIKIFDLIGKKPAKKSNLFPSLWDSSWSWNHKPPDL